ncbi:hypothetical protein BC936DRAFT_138505 [Jimgerdemannia flammicorona]|uniref:Uncharacterized protein n=1 Tax=Jimgerdemannia flammicorona TaxID=994334 RepID=A0A433C9T6_9FUNG|nr:hypothetical protein BC936DRAFT_138505 [Jimgerdemannia flammicorona]
MELGNCTHSVNANLWNGLPLSPIAVRQSYQDQGLLQALPGQVPQTQGSTIFFRSYLILLLTGFRGAVVQTRRYNVERVVHKPLISYNPDNPSLSILVFCSLPRTTLSCTRTEGKTDYYARKRLVVQAKNKYNSPKYRLVVRFTNTDVIAQIVYAKIQGDFILTSAYSHELPRYGIKGGLTNWAAAYATGLLLARRTLVKLGLADKYVGVTEPDGTVSEVEALENAPRPFKAFLDVGLKRTSTGSRVFAALKGASDGGIFIPHSENRFPGYDVEGKKLDAEVLRKYIYGGHVAEYMEYLEGEDEEKYKRQFSTFLKEGLASDDLEGMYKDAHKEIRYVVYL